MIQSYDEDDSSHLTGDRITAEILSRWSDVTGKAIYPSARDAVNFARLPKLLGKADRR